MYDKNNIVSPATYTTSRIFGAIRLPFNIQSSKRFFAGFTTSSNFTDTAD